jgi:DNA-binding IclR family transcriptional regulator
VCDAVIRTRCTASLAVLEGPDVVFSHRVYSHESVPTPSDTTGRERAHRTAAGRLLLADDVRAACGSARAWGLGTQDAARLENDLVQIRRRGFAVRTTRQVSCVAVGLWGGQDGPRIALAVKAPSEPAEIEQRLQLLRPIVGAARSMLAATQQ